MRDKPIKLTLGIIALVAAASVAADDFSLDWWTIDSGGETFSNGGNFELGGTIGQPDASPTLVAGGDYELVGGFWPGVEEICFGDLDGDDEVGLSDLAGLLGHYGTTSGATYYDGDLDGDGDVDLADLAELLGHYGETCE